MGERSGIDDSALCCCEYINEDGERSHMLASLCNCEAVDEAFDRLFTRRSMEEDNIDRIKSTIADRLRIPWRGGAKKLPIEVAGAFIGVIVTIFLGALSWTSAIITYTSFLPALVYTVHRFIRRRVIHDNKLTYSVDGSTHVIKYPKSEFYIGWLVSSIALLLTLYFTEVIPLLKISIIENFVFIALVCFSITSLYLVKATSCAGFESPKSAEIESGAWRICGQCERQVPRQASHCRTCDQCFLLRDHHCIWLNVCINYLNDRIFILGLFSGILALFYAAHLTLTSVCQPRLINLYFINILFPHYCPNAFLNIQFRLSVSAACYSIVLGLLASLALIQQCVCVASGVRLREYRRWRQIPGHGTLSFIKTPIKNCIQFWWR